MGGGIELRIKGIKSSQTERTMQRPLRPSGPANLTRRMRRRDIEQRAHLSYPLLPLPPNGKL